MTENHTDDDRRRFFRITDTLGVAYRVISDEEPEGATNNEQLVDAYSLINNYNKIIESALTDLREKDPVVAHAVDSINKKIDSVLTQLELENLMVQRIAHRVKEVNISACGVAFVVDEKLEANTLVSLDLLLRPAGVHVMAKGKVIGCDSTDSNAQFYVRIEFLEMAHTDQELLIQHIVQRQGVMLRALRDIDN